MSQAVIWITFQLVGGASVPEFLLAAEELNNGHISRQKGYISWKQLVEGETWADLLVFETMEDARKMMEPCEPNALAEKFYSFIDMESCKVQLFSVQKDYALGR